LQGPARSTISWPWWADILLAVGLIAAVEGPALWNASALLTVAAIGAAVAIVLRRRHPVGALSLAVTEDVFLVAAGYDDRAASAFIAVLVVLYTLGVHGPPRRALVATAVAFVTLEIVVVAAGQPEGVVAVAVWTVAVWAAGRVEGASRRQAERLEDTAARLARERDALARLAAIDERSRIARDLHDSVAHTVSVIVLQAGAAEQVLASAPDKARAAARAVEAKGREALGELRELLCVLHDDEEATPRAPQPSLSGLDTLIAEVAHTGLPVELHVQGKPSTLPVGVDVSAYRIIQEALTNALRHAGPVPTTVTLDYMPDAVTVEILDHGNGILQRPADNPGHGLIGMRERVALYHGELQTGPRPDAGYMVRARLPLPHNTP
jgi:signal transduction histidine kinase